MTSTENHKPILWFSYQFEVLFILSKSPQVRIYYIVEGFTYYWIIYYITTFDPYVSHRPIRTITMGHGPHQRRRPPLPPPCWSDKERGGCLFLGARTKHPGAPHSAPQRMAAMGLTSPAASVASPMMTVTWSAVTSAGKELGWHK